MDFNLNVSGRLVLDASPELIEALTQVSGMFKNLALGETTKSTRGKRAKAETATVIEDPQTDASEVPQSGVAPTAEFGTPTTVTKCTLVQVRAAMTAKQESYPPEEQRPVMLKMRDILVALGVKSVGELTEDMYEEFIRKISAL